MAVQAVHHITVWQHLLKGPNYTQSHKPTNTKLHSVTQADKHTQGQLDPQHPFAQHSQTPICHSLPYSDWSFPRRASSSEWSPSTKASSTSSAQRRFLTRLQEEVRYTVQGLPQGLRTKVTIRNGHCPTGSDGSTLKFSPLPRGSLFVFAIKIHST